MSGSETIAGLTGREQDGLWILDDEFWIVAEPLWRSSYALCDYGLMQLRVAGNGWRERQILDFRCWMLDFHRVELGR